MSDSVKAIGRTKDIKYVKYYSPDSIPMNYMSSAIGDDAKIVEDVFEEKSNKEDANTMKYLKKTFTKPERYNMVVTIKQHDSGSKSIMEIRENDGLGRVAQIPYMNPSDGDVNFFEVEGRKYIIVVYGEKRDNILVMETNTMRYSVNHFMNAKDIEVGAISDYCSDPVTVYLNMKLKYGEIGDTSYLCVFRVRKTEDVLHMFKSGNRTIKSRHWTFADIYLYIYTTIHYALGSNYTTGGQALTMDLSTACTSVAKNPSHFDVDIEYIPKQYTNTFTDKLEIDTESNTFYIDAYECDPERAKAFVGMDGYVYVIVVGGNRFTVINVDKEYAINYEMLCGDLCIDDIFRDGKKIYAKFGITFNGERSSFRVDTKFINHLRNEDIESDYKSVKLRGSIEMPIFYYLCKFGEPDKKAKPAKVSLKMSNGKEKNEVQEKDDERIAYIKKLLDDVLRIGNSAIIGYKYFSKLDAEDMISMQSNLKGLLDILNKGLKGKEE